jgi:hypothetical protein
MPYFKSPRSIINEHSAKKRDSSDIYSHADWSTRWDQTPPEFTLPVCGHIRQRHRRVRRVVVIVRRHVWAAWIVTKAPSSKKMLGSTTSFQHRRTCPPHQLERTYTRFRQKRRFFLEIVNLSGRTIWGFGRFLTSKLTGTAVNPAVTNDVLHTKTASWITQ